MGVSGRPKRTARVPARLSDTENVSPTRKKDSNQQGNNGLRSPGGVLKIHNSAQSSVSSSMESLKESLPGKKLAADSLVTKSGEAVPSVVIPAVRPTKRGKAKETAEAEPGSLPVKKKLPVEEKEVQSVDEEPPEEMASKKKPMKAVPESSPAKKKPLPPKGSSPEKTVVEPTRRNRAQKKVPEEGDKPPIARGTRSSSRKSSQEVKEADVPKKKQNTKTPVLKSADSNKQPSTVDEEEKEEEPPAVTEKNQVDKAGKSSQDPKKAATPKKKQVVKKGAQKVDSDLIEEVASEDDGKAEKVVEKKKQSNRRVQKAGPNKSLSTEIANKETEMQPSPLNRRKQISRKPVLKVAPKAAPNKKFLSPKSQVEELFPESSDEEADREKEEEASIKATLKRSAVPTPKKVESAKKRKGATPKDVTKDQANSEVKKAAPLKRLNLDQVISQLDSESDLEEEEEIAEPSIPKRSNRSTAQQPPKPAETGEESTASSSTRSTRRSARSPVKKLPVAKPKVAEPTFPRRSNRPSVQQPSKTVETDQESSTSIIVPDKQVAEPISRRSSRSSTVQQPLKTVPAKSKSVKEVAKPTSRRAGRSSTVQQPSKPNESDEDLSNLIEEVAEPTPSRRYTRPRVQQPVKTDDDDDEDGSTTGSVVLGKKNLKQKKLTDYTAKKSSPTKRVFPNASLVVEEKRVPIWKKVEPKPEPVSSKADDIYELEFSDSEAKPAKKKRKRAPRKPKVIKVAEPEVPVTKPVVKPKDIITHRNTTDRPVVPVEKKKVEETLPVRPKGNPMATLPASGKGKEDAAEPTTPPPTLGDDSFSAGPLIEKKNPGGVTPLLMNVAKKLERYSSNQEEKRMESISFPVPVEEEIPSPPPQMGGDTDRSIFFGGADGMPESPAISDHSTNPVVRLSGPPPMNTSTLTRPAPLDIDNCFGFEELPVESTPMKNQATTSIFVSPILKNPLKKPARLDQSEAGKLMRLVPSAPAAQPAKKQTKLTDYESTIKPVQVDEEPDSGKKKTGDIPPSPPSVFTEPPRRSYSRRSLVVAKRAMFQEDSEHSEVEDDVEEEVAAGPSKKKKKKKPATEGKKKATASSKRDAKMIEWEKLMASHFKDVEEFDLSQ